MIYKHKFLKANFLEGKHLNKVTVQKPLIFMVQNDQFLHYTIQKSLVLMKIPHQIIGIRSQSIEGKKKLMENEIPTLIYQNEVLETVQLMQFLCDASFNDSNIIDFESRKAIIKQLANTWKQIFVMERFWPHRFQKLAILGVHDQNSYQNLIFQELTLLSRYFQDNLLKKTYVSYSDQLITLQKILFVDIISTIKQKIPSSFIDFILRNNFFSLLQLSNNLANIIQNQLLVVNNNNREPQHYVLLFKSVAVEKVEWDNFRLNWQKMLIAFGVVGVMYSIFVKV